MSTASPGATSPSGNHSDGVATRTGTPVEAGGGDGAGTAGTVSTPVKTTLIKVDSGLPYSTPQNMTTSGQIKPEFTSGETEVRKPVLQTNSTVETPISKSTYPLTFANSAFTNPDDLLNQGIQADGGSEGDEEHSRVSAYARLDFESFTFYVQTLQVILGRRSENGSGMVDVHLGPARAISRRHAKIFYNFGSQRFELSVLGRNGAFVSDVFVETGSTVPLNDGTKVQIGQIPFTFVLPSVPVGMVSHTPQSAINPSDASTLKEKSRQLSRQGSPMPRRISASPDGDFNNNLGNDSSINGKGKLRKEYLPEEIPEQYRHKPQHSYSHLIATALRAKAPPGGMSLSEIYVGIQELYPYYKYCPSGWQNSVRHNLSSNRAFKKISKEGKGWMWGLDEEYFSEKELQKKRAAAMRNGRPGEMVGLTDIKAENSKSIAELVQQIPKRTDYSSGSYQSSYVPTGSTVGTTIKQESEGTRPTGISPSPNSIQAQLAANLQNRQRANSTSNVVGRISSSSSPSPLVSSVPSMAAGQNTFRMAPVKTINNPPGSVRTSNSSSSSSSFQQSSQQRQISPSSTISKSSSNLSSAAGLNLSQDTIKALNLLQQKLQSQLPPGTSPSVLTNALAMAIAQAAKSSAGKGSEAISQLLNGRDPAQLAQLLQTALGTIKKETQQGSLTSPVTTSVYSGTVNSTSAVNTAAATAAAATVTTTSGSSRLSPTLSSSHGGQSIATSAQQPMPPKLSTSFSQSIIQKGSGSGTNNEQMTQKPVDLVGNKNVSKDTLGSSINQPSDKSRSSSETGVHSSVQGETASPGSKSSTSAPKSTLAALIQSITPAPGKPPPTASDIRKLLIEARKLKTPSPAIQAAIKQLEGTVARLEAKQQQSGNGGTNMSPTPASTQVPSMKRTQSSQDKYEDESSAKQAKIG